MTTSVWSCLRDWAGKPRLDPRWVERLRRRYEIDGGYADYHAFCRSRFDKWHEHPAELREALA